MAILTQKKNYRTGDAVTATVINDTIETAVTAHDKADRALANSSSALTQSTEALSKSTDAKMWSEAASANAATAIAKATDVEARANSGAFDGANAALVEANGAFCFQIEEGNLMLSYSGGAAPNLSINESGELIYNI